MRRANRLAAQEQKKAKLCTEGISLSYEARLLSVFKVTYAIGVPFLIVFMSLLELLSAGSIFKPLTIG
jgi:hypothetical protein